MGQLSLLRVLGENCCLSGKNPKVKERGEKGTHTRVGCVPW